MIHVALSADKAYTVPLALCLHSMVQTAAPGTEYHFHILDSGVDRQLVERGHFKHLTWYIFQLWQQSPWKREIPYPLISLAYMPLPVARLLNAVFKALIPCPGLLHFLGKALAALRSLIKKKHESISSGLMLA